MIRHLFKLIWNKKKQNSLLIVEMLVSFMVIFAVFTSLVYFVRNYMQPMGIAYKDVWLVSYHNQQEFGNKDSMQLFYRTLGNTLKSMPEVKGVSYLSSNAPFLSNTNGTGLSVNGKQIRNVNVYTVDDSYKAVFETRLREGRWLNVQDNPALSKMRHIVINKTLRELYYGKGTAVGKRMKAFNGEDHFEVVGVVDDMKDKGTYSLPRPSLYQLLDSGDYNWMGNIAIKVRADPSVDGQGAGAAFESRLYKVLANSMKQANIEVTHLDRLLANIDQFTLVPMIIALIVAGFLIVNVALGLFGVLWYNINKRRAEIGLRRAVGATGGSVARQLVSEAMILATLSLVVGVFFAIQFPLLRVFDLAPVVYIIAILLSVMFIYSLVLVCSLYPGKQAAGIYPAVALHEEG